MNNETGTRRGKLSSEFWAIVSVGLVVLGQAAWLDAKIERGDARLEDRLSSQIEGIQVGQAAIRERLAALEAGSIKVGPATNVENRTNAE